MKYRPDIDGLRALAVLSVMLYHTNAGWLPGGFVGVDVFFVISGFVVSASLAASSQRSFTGFLSEFYARRLARIVPALVVMLVVAALLATLFVPRAWLSGFSEQTALSAFLGLSNWVMQNNSDTYFAPRAEYNPYTHTWSLGVEEQFYLICPLLLFLWVRARNRPGSYKAIWPVTILLLLGASSLAASAWATSTQAAAAFYSLQGRFWELAGGAALFQLSSLASTTGLSRPALLLAKFGPWLGLAAVGTGMAFADPSLFPFPWAIPVVIGTLLLIGGVHASTMHPVRRLFATNPAVWIGKRSYSLYLWHWPIFVVMRWTTGLQTLPLQLIALATTFAAASQSYRLVELPLRHNAKLENFRPVLRIAFFVLMALIGREAAQVVFWRTDAIRLSVVSRNKNDWYVSDRMAFPDAQQRVCAVDVQVTLYRGGRITTYHPQGCRGKSATKKLTVIGDSHATAYFPMFEELSAEEGVTVSVYSSPGCSYLSLLVPMAETQTPGCLVFMQAASRQALDSGVTDDMLFLPGLRQHRFCHESICLAGLHLDSLTYGHQANRNRQSAVEEAISWLRPFADRGMAILFEAPTPMFRSPAFRCSDWFNAGNPVCRWGFTQPRAYLERLRAPIVEAMGSIAAVLPAVHIWDPFPILCPVEMCLPFRDGRPLFFDGDHLSAYGNWVVYPSFKATVTAHRS